MLRAGAFVDGISHNRGGAGLAAKRNERWRLAGGYSMRHFVAYQNTEKMGRTLREGRPLHLLTNKRVERLFQNVVWFVTGEGSGGRQYHLGSVFQVSEIGDTSDDGFKHFATGPGHVFEPPVPINQMPWFPQMLRATGNFGLGVQQIKDEAVIAGLMHLAAQDGYDVPTRQYPEPKQRDLTEDEKRQLRERIERGEADIYALAREFGCTSSQVAGIKAAMNR